VSSQDAAYVPERSASLVGWIDSAIRQARPARLIAVSFQFALLLAVMQLFHLEYPSVRLVFGLALIGFVINHLLPLAWRMPFFAVLSLASLAVIVMPANALRLAGVGIVLIGICHLPIRFGWRLALIAAVAVALVLGRAEFFALPGYEAIWPILGSMFMFRLMIYLYDLKNGTAPFGLWRALTYFFMIPNVCFPMFPIVDYQTMHRTYFDEPAPWRTYQIGIKWMFRGLVHLILYRLVAQNWTVGPDHVHEIGTLAQYMVTTFLLYLQISGQFHLIVGLLHLFGFNLPETHHNYLLSSSFTDFWRRINIYWKDFILKLFFNPVYFRVKHLGPVAAMTIATLVAFFFTWLLHSYQWFWIRGGFPITWQEVVFWGLLALLVLVNALYEQKYGRSRAIKGKSRSFASRVGLALRTIGTFCVIVTLWCLWTYQGTFTEWLGLMRNAFRGEWQAYAVVALGLVGLGIAGAFWGDIGREYSASQKSHLKPGEDDPSFHFWRTAAVSTAWIVALLALGLYAHRLPMDEATSMMLIELKRQRLGLQDRLERDQGYYEDLTNTRNYNLALWSLYSRRPPDIVSVAQTPAGLRVPDEFQLLDLKPSTQIDLLGKTFTTNRWRMRDRDYAPAKPDGVFRIALLGTSITMGTGVADADTFENVLEDRLNRELAGKKYQGIEILNFSIAGYGALQKLWLYDRALEFDPDIVIWEAHPTERERLVQHLAKVIRGGVPIPYDDLKELLREQGLDSGVSTGAKLWQSAPDLLVWTWNKMDADCRRRGIKFYVMLLPRVEEFAQDQAAFDELADLARQAKVPILDLTAAYDGVADLDTLRVATWDDHPNADGHRRLADEWYDQMQASSDWRTALGLDQGAPVAPASAATGAVTPASTGN